MIINSTQKLKAKLCENRLMTMDLLKTECGPEIPHGGRCRVSGVAKNISFFTDVVEVHYPQIDRTVFFIDHARIPAHLTTNVGL